jgi:hypothetical protein
MAGASGGAAERRCRCDGCGRGSCVSACAGGGCPEDDDACRACCCAAMACDVLRRRRQRQRRGGQGSVTRQPCIELCPSILNATAAKTKPGKICSRDRNFMNAASRGHAIRLQDRERGRATASAAYTNLLCFLMDTAVKAGPYEIVLLIFELH